MFNLHLKSNFRLSTLALSVASVMSLVLAPAMAYALEAIDDEGLAESTGEGVAFLPEDFSLSMNGADTANGGAGTYGAGNVRLIPVGPLSEAAKAKGYQKADVYLYGMTLGQSKKNYTATRTSDDWGVPFGAINDAPGAADFGRNITSWGSAINPWLIKTLTEPVPDFKGALNDVTYLTLEAPLYKTSTITDTDSDHNLKLGFWTDAFMRNETVAEGTTSATAYNGLSNRLRLNFVWDGFSINGSNIKVFQTLGGVTASDGGTYNATLKINGVPTLKTFNYGLSTSYNKTLGLAGMARMNSRATDSVRGTASFGSVTRQIIQMNYAPATNYNTVTQTYAGSYSEGTVLKTNTVASSGSTPGTGTMSAADANATNSTAGLTESYRPMTNSSLRGPTANPVYKPSYPGSFYDNGICSGPTEGNRSGNSQFGQCLTNEGFTTRRFKASATNSWTPPAFKSVIRIGTKESTNSSTTASPALGGVMPQFRADDGVFLYDANINLILGSLYQPLMLSTDGNNFSIELARIPNVREVYRRIYTRYPGDTGDSSVNYLGSTCNIYQCGTSISGYQGSSATHSSITIGSTSRVTTKTINGITYNNINQIEADKSIGAYGVSIGELKAGSGLTSSLSQDYVQVWNQTRTMRVGTSISCWSQPCYGSNWPAWGSGNTDDQYKLPNGSNFTAHGWQAVAAKPAYTSSAHPSLNRKDPYETTFRQNYNNQVLGIQTTMPVSNMAGTLNNMAPPGATVDNNFGSAVIDGLLIQHFKFSTTGL